MGEHAICRQGLVDLAKLLCVPVDYGEGDVGAEPGTPKSDEQLVFDVRTSVEQLQWLVGDVAQVEQSLSRVRMRLDTARAAYLALRSADGATDRDALERRSRARAMLERMLEIDTSC